MIEPGVPSLRASHSRGTLLALQTLEPDRLALVLAQLEPHVRRGLTEAAASDRIPAAWDLALVRAEVAVIGRDAMRRVARATLVDSLGGPQLGALVSAALGLFGARPPALYGWTGKAWAHVTQGCGALRLDRTHGDEAWLVLEGMPAELVDVEYLEAIAGALEAIPAICKVEGDVSAQPRTDGGRFHARWHAAR